MDVPDRIIEFLGDVYALRKTEKERGAEKESIYSTRLAPFDDEPAG